MLLWNKWSVYGASSEEMSEENPVIASADLHREVKNA